jgi:uncharacterized damage-inducible protein DinB
MMKKSELIDLLIADTQGVIDTVKNEFLTLDQEKLNKRPGPDKWSVLECIEHLNIADAHYLDQFDKKLKDAVQSNGNEFKPGLFGNYFVKMIKPKEDGIIPSPMKTMKKFIPTNLTNANTIEKFLADQEKILNVLERSKQLDLNKIKITSAIGPIVTFKLGDALRFLIGHNERHIIQAQRVLRII